MSAEIIIAVQDAIRVRDTVPPPPKPSEADAQAAEQPQAGQEVGE